MHESIWEFPDEFAAQVREYELRQACCETLEPVLAASRFTREDLAGIGVSGIEFAAFKTMHRSGLSTDLVGMRGRNATTQPGRVYRIDHDGYFIQLDIAKPLPFESACVEWVYAEHLVEHVQLGVAIDWLTEVRRVLVPGGRLRLTTPDLRTYVEGYLHDNGFFAEHRRRLHTRSAGSPDMPARKAYILNQIFYLWGHRWIYDLDELRYALTRAGFRESTITRCTFRRGERADVAMLDRASRKHETMYVEAEA